MPIILNNDTVSVLDVNGQVSTNTNKSLQIFSPKFFNEKLTGKGGTSKGLLSEKVDPKMMRSGYTIIDSNMRYGKVSTQNKTIYNIPCSMITAPMWNYINEIERPELAEMVKIATKNNEEIYLQVPIYAVQIEENSILQPDGKSKNVYDLFASMHVFLYDIKDITNKIHKSVPDKTMFNKSSHTENLFNRFITSDLRADLKKIDAVLTSMGYDIDRPAMSDFFDHYSIYSELCKASERWQTKTAHIIADILIKNVNTFTCGTMNSIWISSYNSVSDIMARLEKYSVPLDQYQAMYNSMASYVSADILAEICKANLNLRLSNTLNHMNQNRNLLEYCPCNTHIQGKIPFSREQQLAIESTSPLTLVQSGAGTGKSTVILGRIDHMIKNGIDPHDITVLSFTNAAADHITDLKPSVNSMTIASMLHKIYEANFPTHQLSTISTIINSLDIYFDPSYSNTSATSNIPISFISNFKTILKRLRDDKEYTQATNYVESNIDYVIKTLDVIRQTSLELESIICYTKMDTLTEPPETQTKHLIIDEVQDNSIAEFIYSIKYVDKHHSSLYIVGDCSQTLYEFRASNPKALNVLESSGVFEIHKLQTNYRSNQEILDFANILLNNIEANQYANIQLKANSLKPVTSQSFKEAVSLHYERLKSLSDTEIDSMYIKSISSDMKDYIDDKLAKKEQICILAFAGKTLFKIQQTLQTLYPTAKITSLVPKKSYDSTIFSQFIARFWGQVTFVPPQSVLDSIETIMKNNIPCFVSKSVAFSTAESIVLNTLGEFRATYAHVIADWEKQVQQNLMHPKQLLEEIKKLMIDFEIKKNGMARALLSKRNEEAKTTNNTDDADFILSTIHSAKGLEFDNVIVYYKNESETTMEESTKRVYYVAFTRAKKTEFIYAYDKMARPKIEADYERIIKSLTAQAKANGTLPQNDPSLVVMPASLTPMALPDTVTSFKTDIPSALATPINDADPITSSLTKRSYHLSNEQFAVLKKKFKTSNIKDIHKITKLSPRAKRIYNKILLRKPTSRIS